MLRKMGALILGLAVPAYALAQSDYPSRPVRMIVPYAPGGITDLVTRLVSIELGKSLGQTVVVDNRPGANSMLGAGIVANARPDGYTLCTVIASHAANETLYPKKPFHAVDSFTPVTLMGSAPLVLVVNTTLPIENVKDLVAYARARPGQLSFGSSGVGASTHLSMELLMSLTGIRMVHIPYKGSNPALTDLIGGHIAAMFTVPSSVLSFAKTGKARVVAIASERRSELGPEIPTVGESGLPGFVADTWVGMLAPAGTPASVVNRLAKEVRTIVHRPDIKQRFHAIDIEPIGNSPKEFADFLKAEVRKWGKVIKDANVKPE